MKRFFFFLATIFLFTFLSPLYSFAQSPSPTGQATSSLPSSPLSDFPSGNYSDYYTFAKSFLFDDENLFTTHSGKTPPYYPSDYKKAMFDVFGITLSTETGLITPHGDSTVAWPDNYMKWVWEAFWNMPDVFIKGVKNTTTIYIVKPVSWTVCNRGDCFMQLRDAYGEQQFKAILTHEFSHVFDFSNTGGKIITYRSDIDAVYAAEGGLTYYSQGCGGSMDYGTRMQEDYAEMLTYYIYPNIPESTNCSNGGQNDRYPYKNGAHPLHFALAKKILGE